MKRAMTALLLGLLMLVGASGSAEASTKFKNNSPNTIWTAHAFASTSGFLCGWSDGCSGVDGDWRVRGWWQIAPGGTATVHGSGYGNAYHDAYGEDAFGHVWGGAGANADGGTYCAPDNAFDWCSNICNTNSSWYFFFRARGSRCCGGTCPTNGTVNFN